MAKIAELNQAVAQKDAEIAALRSKCVELTNALSAKTEQFSSFQSDQSKIEEGILKALERLNAVESTVLSVANATAQASAQASAAQPTSATPARKLFANESTNPVAPAQQSAAQKPVTTEPEPPVSPDMTVEQAMQIPEEQYAPIEAESNSGAADVHSESIEPDITFDDAPLSPDQGEASSQGQFDIF
ncbi:MAG: hypothetical protein IJP62_02405 [Treponema sp.]|nr:hypothetical protein [Treponema sp.]